MFLCVIEPQEKKHKPHLYGLQFIHLASDWFSFLTQINNKIRNNNYSCVHSFCSFGVNIIYALPRSNKTAGPNSTILGLQKRMKWVARYLQSPNFHIQTCLLGHGARRGVGGGVCGKIFQG